MKYKVEILELGQVIALAGDEPLKIITSDGRVFILTSNEDYEFQMEVAELRQSEKFNEFLETRRRPQKTYSVDELLTELEGEKTTGLLP